MEYINHFLTSYAIETALFTVFVTVLVAVVILKQKKDRAQNSSIDKPKVEQVEPKTSVLQKEQEISHTSTAQPKQVLQIPKKLIEKRREVPPHGAITKESFEIFKGSKLLVAEDNMINQKVIKGMLGDSGIEIIMANNGQEALEILRDKKDIYIVLMDAHMPIVDGFEATEHIRADRSLDHLLVVALSGDTAIDDIKKMKNAGMQEYLEKPLKIEKLYDILYAYIDTVDGIILDSEPLGTLNPLHISEGVEICGGDSELFKEIITEFLSTYADTDIKIKSFIQKEDYNSAEKILLDISGIAANIGAPQLADVSTKFREILNHEERDDLLQVEKEFTQTLSALCTEIKFYLKS